MKTKKKIKFAFTLLLAFSSTSYGQITEPNEKNGVLK
jgi:hypothetical protein